MAVYMHKNRGIETRTDITWATYKLSKKVVGGRGRWRDKMLF